MRKSTILAWATLCFVPSFFAFKNIEIAENPAKKIIVKVEPVENKKAFVLRMYNLQKKPVRVLIKNEKRNDVYSELVLDHNGYRKMINLWGYKPGTYKLYIFHPLESKMATISVEKKSVKIIWEKNDFYS